MEERTEQAAEPFTVEVGDRIRRKREERGLSVRALARLVDVAPSYISQVERGLTTPSIPKLRQISEVLQVPVFWLFVEDEEPRVVVRREHRRRLALAGSDHEYELLTSHLGGQLQVMVVRLEPSASTQPEPKGHRGEEVAVVLTGTVRLELGGRTYELREGDSAHYEGVIPHRYTNVGDGPAVVLFSMTPPV